MGVIASRVESTHHHVVDGKCEFCPRARRGSAAIGPQDIAGLVARVFREKLRTLLGQL